MKKILSIIIAVIMLCAALPAYAYSTSDYHAKAAELNTLIAECKALGINTQYEEIDANIIDVYADRIAEFQSGGLSSSITNFQLSELDSLYTNAKANLTAYKNGTKQAPAKAYTYKTGDGYSISGKSMLNSKGKPYFSAGFGHFGMSGHVEELSGYGYDNIQSVTALGDVVTNDRAVDSWDTGISGGADITFTQVSNYGLTDNTSLHVVNNSDYAANVYGTIFQRVPVKPGTEYEFSFYIRGTSEKSNACYYMVNDWSGRTGAGSVESGRWRKISDTFTTGEDEYFRGIRFIFEKTCDYYIDNISVCIKGKSRNAVINGGFDGDGSDDFDIFYNESTSFKETLKTLNAAEKNNAHVEVLLQLQQNMPSCITTKYPEIASSGRYNIDHAAARTVEAAYIPAILGPISDYSSLGSIIAANEPNYNSLNYSYSYNTKFANYLQEKYGTISALKSAYGNNSYSSFSNVGLPSGYEATPRFYDWKSFNDSLFTSWYSRTRDTVKSCIPGIPLSIKIQSDFMINDNDYDGDIRNQMMTMGIDAESLGALSDFQGNDSYSYYEDSGTERNALKWYDYLSSVSGKPVYDSEKHITADSASTFNTNNTKFVKNVVWQSMVHGLDMFSVWTWDLTTDSSSTRYGHLAFRPGALSEVSKAAMDANRLSEQVSALANAVPSAAVLRSDASRIYNNRYMHSLTFAYNAACEAGHKVGFVTPGNIAEKLPDYDVLIIPYATNVEESVINAIYNYTGKILIMDNSSLNKNQYDQSYSGTALTKINAIKNKATVLSVSAQFGTTYKISSPSKATLKTELVKDRALVVANSGGTLQDNLEYSYVPYQNGYLVNVSNYDTSNSRAVSIKLNGSTFSNITSLLDMQSIGSSITVPAMTSGIYYARNVNDEIVVGEIDEGGGEEETTGENRITSLNASRTGVTNLLEWTSKESGSYNVYSVNPDGSLTFIFKTNSESFSETSAEVKTYKVTCANAGGEDRGKCITCGANIDSLIPVTTSCTAGKASVGINYTNSAAYSVAFTVTVTAYNSDGSFAEAAILEELVPAGKTVTYGKTFGTSGTGSVIVTKK